MEIARKINKSSSLESTEASNETASSSDSVSHKRKINQDVEMKFLNTDSLLTPNIKIYVRLRPHTKDIKFPREQDIPCYIIKPSTLFFNVRRTGSHIDKNKNVQFMGRGFEFSDAYGPEVNQEIIFESIVEPQLVNFFAGKNCTVMAYGTVDSGKSYTLEGSSSNPGLIPRILQQIFSLKNPKLLPKFKPMNNHDIESLNEIASTLEIQKKKKILSLFNLKGSERLNQCSRALKKLKNHFNLKSKDESEMNYEIWISYAEIRDEKLYDLLSSSYNRERSCLKLDCDTKEKYFIKDLIHIPVASAAEAWELFICGQNNLRKYDALWNTKSSMSHCIFNIILINYSNNAEQQNVQMSRFSFCDLAAQEYPDADTSLIDLVKSLKAASRDSRRPNGSNIDFFCASKLTRLFQDALIGKEQFSLIVNVNSSPNLCKETLESLHLTALKTKAVTKVTKIHPIRLITNFGKILMETGADSTVWDDLSAEDLDKLSDTFDDEIQALETANLITLIETHEIIIKKYSAMIERISNIKRRKEKNLPKFSNSKKRKSSKAQEEEFEKKKNPLIIEVDTSKKILEQLRAKQQIAERELTRMKNILSNKDDSLNNKNLLFTIVAQKHEIKHCHDKISYLTNLLDQARSEVDKLMLYSSENDKKLGEIEKQYIDLKFDKESDLIFQRETNYSYKLKCEMLENFEIKLGREQELKQFYQAKYEKLKNMEELFNSSKIEHEKKSTNDASTSTDNEFLSEQPIDTSSEVLNIEIKKFLSDVSMSIPERQNSPQEPLPISEVENIFEQFSFATKIKNSLQKHLESVVKTNTPLQESLISVREAQASFPAEKPSFVDETRIVFHKPSSVPETNNYIQEPSTTVLETNSSPRESSISVSQAKNFLQESMISVSDVQTPLKKSEFISEAENPLQEPSTTDFVTQHSPPVSSQSVAEAADSQNKIGEPENPVFLNELMQLPFHTSSISNSKDSEFEQLKTTIKVMRTQLDEVMKNVTSQCKISVIPESFVNTEQSNILEIPKIFDNLNETVSEKNFTQNLNDTFEKSNTSLRRSKRKKNYERKYTKSIVVTNKRQKLTNCSDEGSFECDNCDKTIIDALRYHCSLCRRGDFDLCHDCYERLGHIHDIETLSTDL